MNILDDLLNENDHNNLNEDQTNLKRFYQLFLEAVGSSKKITPEWKKFHRYAETFSPDKLNKNIEMVKPMVVRDFLDQLISVSEANVGFEGVEVVDERNQQRK